MGRTTGDRSGVMGSRLMLATTLPPDWEKVPGPLVTLRS